MAHETATEKPATLGQIKEIAATLVQAMPSRLSRDVAQRIIEEKGWLVSEVQKLFAMQGVEQQFDVEVLNAQARKKMMVSDFVRGIAIQIGDWALFYSEVFNLDVHYSVVDVPIERVGFDRLIVVAEGLTLKRVIEAARRYFPVDLGNNDGATQEGHDRLPTQTYSVWVRDSVEPDEKFNDVRPGILERRFPGVKFCTVLEHLLLHLKYYRETGRFLDRKERYTVCAGSLGTRAVTPAIYVKKSRDGKFQGICFGYGPGPYSAREVIA